MRELGGGGGGGVWSMNFVHQKWIGMPPPELGVVGSNPYRCSLRQYLRHCLPSS